MARPPPVEQTFYYAVPPSTVFAALTEPAQLARWFVKRAAIAPRKGSAFRLTWHGGYSMAGKVQGATRPRRLVLAWNDRFDDGKVFRTEVRFDLRKKGKGTLLTVTHRGFKGGKRWTALYGGIAAGWAHYLTNLRSVLEHGTDLRSDLDRLS